MDFGIDNGAYAVNDFHLVGVLCHGLQLRIDTRAEGEINAAFVLKDARLHAEQVVALRFLEFRVAAACKEFAGLQIIVGVVFVGYGQRCDVQPHEPFGHEFGVAAESEHFDYTFLGKVVGILRAPLALGEPYRLVFLADAVADVARELLCGLKSFGKAQIALYDDALVEPYEVLDPGVDKQVVAESHLLCGKSVANHHKTEKRCVEHYVTVVGNEQRVVAGADVRLSAFAYASGGLALEQFENAEHHRVLELVFAAQSGELRYQRGVVCVGHYVLYGVFKARFSHELLHVALKFAVVERGYILKFFLHNLHDLHNLQGNLRQIYKYPAKS